MFRPSFIRLNASQRIPPYPSNPVFETIKTKTLNGTTSVIDSETFDLDPGIYEITITTPLKEKINRTIDGDVAESSSRVGKIKQVLYNVLPTKCYAHYCNDYIIADESNLKYPHLETKSSFNQTGNIYTGYGEYFIVRTKYNFNSRQATNMDPPLLGLPSLGGLTDYTEIKIGNEKTSSITSWHILAGYNANTIPIDLQKIYYSTKEVVEK